MEDKESPSVNDNSKLPSQNSTDTNKMKEKSKKIKIEYSTFDEEDNEVNY